jgi:hypothetical protein
MTIPTIKIFISSPSDVLYERQIAKRIIAKLGKEFATSVRLEALLWEDMPLQATASFQEGIDRIVNANLVDIAVFILWSRLGTPLSEKFLKPDGSLYKSGTEYEFEMMFSANQQSGTPSILAYIKNAPIADAIFQSSASADFDFEEIGKQHKEAQRFIREKFYDSETKTVYGAYHQFEASTTFEQKLTEHLRRLIVQKIGHDAVRIEWEGNPYVGLRSFRYDESAIFYGRRHTINAIEEKIAHFLPDRAPCLFVLGESGSGKSSLVRAGLLPDMIEFEWVENKKWKWFDLMPSQFRGNVYDGLLSKLVEAFPALNEKAIGKDLLAGKEVNFDHLSDVLPSKTNEAVLFFIDQFEEIFTDPLITEEERIRTFALLQGMASTHKIWLFFSMRNDFYHKFISYPALSALKNESIVFDIHKILHSELQEIIEEPAKKAGLQWEANEKGIALSRTILKDINKGVDDLPLIEFALSELYNLRDENNMLTYKAYLEIGKIDGAVVKYVDNFYNTLSEKEKELFYEILSALIAPSVENKNLYVRKTALLKDLQKSDTHRALIDNLINSHILVSGKDAKGEPTVSIVHEILISSWNIIQDWITQEKYFIDANNHYENLSKYWIEHNKSKEDLLQGSVAMKEAEYFLFSWENNCTATVKDFLFASIKRKKRTLLPGVLFFLLGSGIACFVLLISHLTRLLSNDSIVKSQMEGFLPNFIIVVLLSYVTWKKIKAVPSYQTINVSLVFWSVFFIFIIVLTQFSSKSGFWILYVLLLAKLVLTVIEKREILQWKKRIFKRRFTLLSTFLDKSTTFTQKIFKGIVWGVSVLLIISFCLGVPTIVYLIGEKNRLERTNNRVDALFERINNMTALSKSEQIFFNRQRAGYLKENFLENNNKLAGWNININTPTFIKRKFDYAFIQYILGYPEDFLAGINEGLKSYKLAHYPKETIKAAFELGLFDDCQELIMLYKKAMESASKQIDNEIILIENELRSGRLSAFSYPGDEANTALAQPFTGNWQCEENDTRVHWEITKDNYNLSRYIIQSRSIFLEESVNESNRKELEETIAEMSDNKWIPKSATEKVKSIANNLEDSKWIDDDIAVTRYRFKQTGNQTMIEEYNARTNVLSVSEIVPVNDNELQVKMIDNGSGKIESIIRFFKRVK